MNLDATEVGVVAARVMEDLEQDARENELGDEPMVVAAAVIYEVRSADGASTVGLRVTDDRNVLGLGLIERARQALISPDD